MPKSLGLAAALKNVPQMISFATFPTRPRPRPISYFQTTIHWNPGAIKRWRQVQVRRCFRAHNRSWCRSITQNPQWMFSWPPHKKPGESCCTLPFNDELVYIQSKLKGLVNAENGFFSAADIDTFTAYFQQNGGWWKTGDNRIVPSSADVLSRNFNASSAQFNGAMGISSSFRSFRRSSGRRVRISPGCRKFRTPPQRSCGIHGSRSTR